MDRDVLIMGAGIAGLTAAKQLQSQGLRVAVLEKSRCVGGRLATRRMAGGRVDHGAQFFTVRDQAFARQVQRWVMDGTALEWSKGFASPDHTAHDGTARLRGAQGMSDLAKSLARNVDVHMDTRVTTIQAEERGWLVRSHDGRVFRGANIILSAPVPQSLAILDASRIALPPLEQSTLRSIEYCRCIALLAALSGDSSVPPPGAFRINREPLIWIADNKAKGICKVPIVTIHGGPGFSRHCWDDSDATIAERMLLAARRWIQDVDVLDYEVHRWRYSEPLTVHPERCLSVKVPHRIIFAGDAFGGPRVEGAALSGSSAAHCVTEEPCGLR